MSLTILEQIKTKQIKDEEYYYANYEGFKVVMRKSNGFINATHLFKISDEDKFHQWQRKKSNYDEFYKKVQSMHNVKITYNVRKPKYWKYEPWYKYTKEEIEVIPGAYAHPELIQIVMKCRRDDLKEKKRRMVWDVCGLMAKEWKKNMLQTVHTLSI